jgi:hypothetical protein
MAKSIKNCIKTLTSAGELAQATADDVVSRVSQYVKDGYSAKEANQLAITDAIDEQKDELRSVYSQLAFNAANDPILGSGPIEVKPARSKVRETKVENKGVSDESAIRTGEEYDNAGTISQIPERAGWCYKYAAYAAQEGKGFYVVGSTNAGDHAVVISQETGNIYDATFNRWFGADLYAELTEFKEVFRLTGKQVTQFGRTHGKFPDRTTIAQFGMPEPDDSAKGPVQEDLGDNREQSFKATREAQRYGTGISGEAPENIGIRFKYGGQMQQLLEHVGDLVNRAAMPSNDTESGAGVGAGGHAYGLEALREKVPRALRYLDRIDEFEAQIERNADYYARENGVSRSSHLDAAYAEMRRYADAYAQIPVFTKLQRLSRDAAVAIGKRDYAAAKELLGDIEKIITSDTARKQYATLETKTQEDTRTDDIVDSAMQRVIDRTIAQMQGNSVSEPRKVFVTARLKRALDKLENGKITNEQFVGQMEQLFAELEFKKKVGQSERNPRVRGDLHIREKLLNAVRNGDISQREADLAEWFIKQNPALVEDLGISIKSPFDKNGLRKTTASGNYETLRRVFTLFSGQSKPTTATHEILHHLERLMPAEFQNAIRSEWLTGIGKELAKRPITQAKKWYLTKAILGQVNNDPDMVRAALIQYKSGETGTDTYQWMNPSEYWAVNGARILDRRFEAQGSVWKKIYTWMMEFLEKVKEVFGMQSNAAIIRTLDEMIHNSKGGKIDQTIPSLGYGGENDLQNDAEEGKNAVTGDLSRVNADVRDAVYSLMARKSKAESERVFANLAANKGTAWAAAAVKGMVYREMLERAMEGKDVTNLAKNEIWGKVDFTKTPSTMTRVNALKAYNKLGDTVIHGLIDAADFLADNTKAENDVSTSFTNCDPSKLCAITCYAADGGARPFAIGKGEFNEFLIEKFPARVAEAIARQYKVSNAGRADLALRINEKGDLSEAQVKLIEEMNKLDIPMQVFSKRPELLREVKENSKKAGRPENYNWLSLSIDSSNIDVAYQNPDLQLAVVIDDNMTEEMLIPLNDRVAVYLPVNYRNKSPSEVELRQRFPKLYAGMVKETLCPVDSDKMGLKKGTSFVTITSDKATGRKAHNPDKVWTCTACDFMGNAGCFKGNRQTNERKAAAITLSGGMLKNMELIRVRKELQSNLDRMLELGGINAVIHKQLSDALREEQREVREATDEGTAGGVSEASSGGTEATVGSGKKTRRTGRRVQEDLSNIPQVQPTWGPQTTMPLNGQTGGPSWGIESDSRMTRLIYQFQNRHVDTKDVMAAIQSSSGPVVDKFNPYQKEELYHKRTEKRTTDFFENELRPLLTQMRMNKVGREEFEDYLHARHAKEANDLILSRMGDDGGSGMTDQQADDYFANLDPAKQVIYERLAAKVDAIIDETRRMIVDYQLESQGTVDTWKQQFAHYVPLNRADMEEGAGIGQGFSVRGSVTKARTGSTREVVDILANIAQQRDRVIIRGEKNRIASAIYGLAYLHKSPDFWEADKAPKMKVLDSNGQIITITDPRYKSAENVVAARIKDAKGNVHDRYVVFNERNERALRMARSLKNLEQPELNGVLQVMGAYSRWVSAINTQYNPVFVGVNAARDIQAGLINLSSTQLRGMQAEVFANAAKAMVGIWGDLRAHRAGRQTNSQWSVLYEKLQLSGGTTGFRDMFLTAKERTEKQIERELDPDWWVKTPIGKAVSAGGLLKAPEEFLVSKVGGYLFGVLSDMNEVAENVMRLAVYKTYLDRYGADKQDKAASLAKNITVNFNRKGNLGTHMNAAYAFFNAAMQGTARMAETLTGPAGKQVVAGGILLGVAQSFMLAAAFGDDDDDPPEFVRERSFVIPLGDKRYFAMPMPLGLHVLPNIGRLLTDAARTGKVGKAAGDMMSVLAEAFNPIGNAGISWQTLAPSIVDPIIALLENKDWNGRSISRSSYDKNEPGYLRSKDTATPFAKGAAKLINDSSAFAAETFGNRPKGMSNVAGPLSPTPDQIDYLIGQVTGGVGRETAKVFQLAGSMVTGEEMPVHKIPIVGRVYGEAKGQAHEAQKFYERLNRINSLNREVEQRRLQKQDHREFIRENPEAKLGDLANQVQFQLSQLRKRKRDYVAKDNKTGVKETEAKITELMKKFNTKIDQFNERSVATM